MSSTRFYKIWAGAIKRCENKNFKQYEDYGGRGITVCDKWKSFENFYGDMYEPYLKFVDNHGEKNTTIDRVDVNGDYTPDNCRWSTKSEQSINQRIRNTNKSGVTGVYFSNSKRKWIAKLCLNYKTFYLGSFDELADAESTRRDAEKIYKK
jgi:hypothetical protein